MRLTLDAVTGPDGTVVVGIVGTTAAGTGEPPVDLRHANPRALQELRDSLALDEQARVWRSPAVDADVADTIDRVRDLAVWCAWTSALEGRAVDEVLITERVGVRHLAERPVEMMPSPATVAFELRRAAGALARIGIDGAEPTVRAVAFGIPATPRDVLAARVLAILEVDAAGAGSLHSAPPRAVLETMGRACALCAAAPRSLLAIANELVELRSTRVPGDRLSRFADRITARLASRLAAADERAAAAALRVAVAELAGIADAREGNYEACELVLRILEQAIDGVPLVERLTAGDPWLRAQFWWVRGRIANHRGDPEVALRASRDASQAAAGEWSLRARLLAVEADTLALVAAQNHWPYDAEVAGCAQLAAAAAELEQSLPKLRSLAASLGDAPLRRHEARLAMGEASEPRLPQTDPTLGAALGTLARSHAFLGDHAQARSLLLEARAHFTSRLDRTVNTCFLAHVELDDPALDPRRLQALFNLLVPRPMRRPEALLAQLAGDAASRFAIALLVKALVLGADLIGLDARAWCGALAETETCDLVARHMTHPGEMIARHAGELLRGKDRAATRWFELGIAIGAAGGRTLQQIGRFTRHIADGHGANAAAPRGSVFNPCYEYR